MIPEIALPGITTYVDDRVNQEKPSTIKTKYYVEYFFLRGFISFLHLLPLRAALFTGWILAVISLPFTIKRRKEARRRMRQVFGDGIPESTLRKWAWISWRNLFFNIVDTARAPRLNTRELTRRIIPGTFDQYKAASETIGGHVLAVCHMGNWDVAGFGGRILGLPLFVLSRRQKNPLFEAYLKEVRDHFQFGTIDRHGSLSSIAKRIKAGEIFVIMPDVRAKEKETALKVPFLGGSAYLMGGMALFARLTNKPIATCIVTRVGWTRHRWEFPPLVYPDPAADREADILRMTTEVLQYFDRAIREHPEQYFWYNKRWVLDDRF